MTEYSSMMSSDLVILNCIIPTYMCVECVNATFFVFPK